MYALALYTCQYTCQFIYVYNGMFTDMYTTCICVYCMCIQHVHNDMYTCPGGVVSVIRLGKIEPFG
jgi:hypothetical protein